MKHGQFWWPLAAAAVAAVAVGTATTRAQGQPAPNARNDHPNPYSTVEGWAKMPEGRTWGSTSSVDIDKDGVSVWVGERCGANSCLTSTLDPVLKFDNTGKLVRSFGAGLVIFPHGITVDRDGNVWIVDGQDNAPRPQRARPRLRLPQPHRHRSRWDRRPVPPRDIRSSSSAPRAKCC
jgi:streptogramin lyase